MSTTKLLAVAAVILSGTLIQSPVIAAVPKVVSISPAPGSTDVDTATSAIVVRFDQPMGKGMSWTGGGPHYPTIDESQKLGWSDNVTCVLPVTLEPGKVYRLGLNSTSFQNFRNVDGEPLPPQTIMFATAGAPADDVALMTPPKVSVFDPPNNSKNVPRDTQKLSVTFNQPMGGGMSWTGGGENFPEITGEAEWSEDKRTCTVPVKLKANTSYRLGINSPSHKNFSNALGVPAEPAKYEFHTAAD